MARKKQKDLSSAEGLRTLGIDELRMKLREQRKAYVATRFKHATATLEKTSELKAMRKIIARMETVLTEKQGA